MSDTPLKKSGVSLEEDDWLEFLREEGLEMLSLFRKIRDRQKRDLILDLIRALLDAQGERNGGA